MSFQPPSVSAVEVDTPAPDSDAPLQTDMGWGKYAAGNTWTYHLLPEPRLSEELARLSQATKLGDADCVSFQPSPNPEQRSQDRYVVENWEVDGRTWRLSAIFDGHSGHDMVDHTVQNLPPLLREAISALVTGLGDSDVDVEAVSNTITRTIANFDDAAAKDLFAIFPGGQDEISKLSDEEVSAIINTPEVSPIVLRCMRGTTALVSLLDPLGQNLWVASLGDCQAALGTREASGDWTVKLLSSNHNGKDPAETERIRNEHPGEAECVTRNRVLGAIAITRAIGDHVFKLPRIYTDRVFLNSKIGFRFTTASISDILPRNVTPPYLSNIADVQHVRFGQTGDGVKPEQVLVMCSDGLMDLFSDRLSLDARMSVDDSSKLWFKAVESGRGDSESNLALRLLRDALGGEDEAVVSRMITVEMTDRWMDDTTIIVQKL